jgi:K+-transporting ATPase ATPase A chain
MNATAVAHVSLLLVALTLFSKPLGVYIYWVMEGSLTRAGRLLGPLERALYRWCGVDAAAEMSWTTYVAGLLIFNTVGALFLYLLQRLQSVLPLNPAQLGLVAPDSAFNTAISFATNTSWQSYAGETTLGYLAQMVGIASQSFLSAATGIAVLMTLLRGFGRVGARTVGNVWVDLTRGTLYVLLPLAVLFSLMLISQGAIQNLRPNRLVALLEPATYAAPKLGPDGTELKDDQGRPTVTVATTRSQTLPMGPVASQTAIALLSGDGGGFFNANSAHPYANPTPVSNFLEMIAILLIPAALCHTFGKAVGDTRQGWAILSAMGAVFVLMSTLAIEAEQAGNGVLAQFSLDQTPGPTQTGGNMEGKEARFGIVDSALFATVTTSGGDGAVNSMHDSLTPSSTANNNGSAFAGLAANSLFYNVTTAVAMWFGRFVPLVAVLAIAGSLAAKRRRASGPGTLPTHSLLFISLLLGTILAIGALTYVPALALGPVAEELQMPAEPSQQARIATAR